MKRTTIVLGMLLAASLVFADYGKASTVTETASSTAAWNGFGADFQPTWIGDTEVVKTTPEVMQALQSATGCGVLGTTMNCTLSNYNQSLSVRRVQRWTVNKISSSAWSNVQTAADYKLVGKEYSASSGNSATNWSEMARYAEVVTDNGLLLAGASAIACQSSGFQGQSFSASGKVAADGLLLKGDTAAQSSARGTSCFRANYALEKDTPFSFSLDMAKLDDVTLKFSAVDTNTGEEVWSLSPSQEGLLSHQEFGGILSAGEYTFSLDAITDLLIDQDGVRDSAGQAMYDVSLDFEAESYWVTVGHLILLSCQTMASQKNRNCSFVSPMLF